MKTLRYRLAGCALLLVVSSSGMAQSLQVTPIRLVMGQPAELQVQIRPESLHAEHCLELHLSSGERSLEPVVLTQTASTDPSSDEGLSVRVRTRHPIPEPWLQGRAIWRCGARFIREFMWLVDPPAQAVREPPRPSKRTTQSPAQAPKSAKAPPGPRPPTVTTPPHPEIARLLQAQQRLEASLLELEARWAREPAPAELQARPASAESPPARIPLHPSNAGLGELGQGMLIGCLATSLLMGLGWRLGQRGRAPLGVQLPTATPRPEPTTPSTRARSSVKARHSDPPAVPGPPMPPPAQTAGLAEGDVAPGAVVLDLPADLPFELAQIDLSAHQGFTGAAVAMIESALDQHPGQLPAGLLLRLVEHYQQLGRPVDLTRVSWPLEHSCRVDPGREGPSVLADADLSQRLTTLWRGEDRAAQLARWLLRPTTTENAETAESGEAALPVLGRLAFRELLDLYLLARGVDKDTPAGCSDSDPDRPQLQGEALQRLDAAELGLAAPELQIRNELIG